MASTVMIHDGTGTQGPDFWNVTFDVYFNPKAVTTDVMLVQGLLNAYFLSPAGVTPHLQTKAMEIISRSASPGKRFDDGIYGDNTRAVMSLFEEDMRAPFRDGIVRKVPISDIVEGPDTKLKRLNFAWNMTMLGGAVGDTKEETGLRALHPVLVRELYPF